MLGRILNILGWIGTGLVVAAVGVRFARPELQQVWYGLAVAGLVCVLLYLLSQWREIAGTFTRRQARYGALSVASALIVLGILVAINYIAARQNKRWDLTANKAFSLSDQSVKVLQSLKEPVKLTVFDKDLNFARWRDRLDEYGYASKQVQIEYVDADKEPARARQAAIQQYGTVLVEHAGRTERATSDTEQDVTNAIIKAVEGKQKKVYFVQGHGEHDTASSDDRVGYSSITAALGRDNFTVEKLVLAQQRDVPDDAAVVVIAGPSTDYLAPEMDMLRRYLEKSGKLLMMLDPPERGTSPPLTNLIALAHDYGVDVGNNVVVDVSGVGQLLGRGAGTPVAASYPSHPITERFSVISAFPLARTVGPVTGGVNGRTAQSFIETSERSWAESDLSSLSGGEVSLDEKQGDKPGPISIAAAVSVSLTPPPPPAKPGEPPPPDTPKKETRVAVVGDSDFAANDTAGIPGNSDLFLNTVNWLAQQENLISIRPKEGDDRRVTLSADAQRRMFLYSVLLVPGIVLAAGAYTWWRRR